MSTRTSSPVCWDTSVLLAMINNEAGRVGHCKAVFQAAESGDYTIYVSAICITECSGGAAVARLPQAELDNLNKKIRNFFRHSFVIVVHVDQVIAELSRELQQGARRQFDHKLPTMDSLHLATALTVGAHVLHSYDSTDLLPLSRRIIPAIGQLPWIENPNKPYIQPLPEST